MLRSKVDDYTYSKLRLLEDQGVGAQPVFLGCRLSNLMHLNKNNARPTINKRMERFRHPAGSELSDPRSQRSRSADISRDTKNTGWNRVDEN
jgi:hypothetical protein